MVLCRSSWPTYHKELWCHKSTRKCNMSRKQHLICPTKGHSSPTTFLMESQCPWLPVTPSSPKWASSLGLAVSSCTLYNREGRRPRVWGTRSYHSLCRINHQCHTKNSTCTGKLRPRLTFLMLQAIKEHKVFSKYKMGITLRCM